MRPGPRWILLGVAFVTGIAISVALAAGFSLTSHSLTTFKSAVSPPGCTQQTNTLSADRDSYVNVGTTENFGSAATLRVESGGGLPTGGTRSRTVIRFALPAIPQGCTLTTATLRLYNQTPFSGRTIQAFRLTSDWGELTVNGNTTLDVAGSAATSTSPGAAGYQTWTVTSQVQEMYTGTNYGFLVRDETESTSVLDTSRVQVYESRDAATANDPQLVITWN